MFLTMRFLRPHRAPPIEPSLAHALELRYDYDCARDPELYPMRKIAKVTREGDGSVYVLWDLGGEVLNRYRLRQMPTQWSDPPSLVYQVLQEL